MMSGLSTIISTQPSTFYIFNQFYSTCFLSYNFFETGKSTFKIADY